MIIKTKDFYRILKGIIIGAKGMDVTSSIIETGVDKLVKLVKDSGRIAAPEAAKILNVSETVVMEWADFLEEEGIINIEYKLTKPFLVERKLTKKEVEKKSKEFETTREIFVRKAEATLGSLDRQAEELKSVKEEFENLKKKFGIELGSVKEEIRQLENYDRLREDLTAKISNQKREIENTMGELINKINIEEKKLKAALESLENEESELDKEKFGAKAIIDTENRIIKIMSALKHKMSKLDERLEKEDTSIKSSEDRITSLKETIQSAKDDLIKDESMLKPLLEKSKEYESKIMELHDKIARKIKKGEKASPSRKQAAAEIKKLFKKKFASLDLIDKVNKDRDSLHKDFVELIKKAKSYHLTSNIAGSEKQMLELEKKFGDVDKKRKKFEEDYKKLKSMLKK